MIFDSAVGRVRSCIRGAGEMLLFATGFKLPCFQFQVQFYCDKVLSIGCPVSCSAFEGFSTMLEWAFSQKAESDRVTHII